MGCSDESHNKRKGRWHDEHAEKTPDDNQGGAAVDQDGTEAYRTRRPTARRPTAKGIPHHWRLLAISRLIVAACRLMPPHAVPGGPLSIILQEPRPSQYEVLAWRWLGIGPEDA